MRTYVFQLVDNPARKEGWFGLADGAGHKKASFFALKNLMHALADTGANQIARQAEINYTIAGNSKTLQQMKLTRRDGGYYLVMWRAVRAWAKVDRQMIDIRPEVERVTFTSPVNVEIYRPSESDKAVQSLKAVRDVAVPLTGSVAIIKVTQGA